VEGLSEALHYEMETIGVKVKIVEPGVVSTDFSGRSLDTFMDPKMKEYMPIIKMMIKRNPARAGSGRSSEPKIIAEVIYRAATDGTDKMRYPAGPDAIEILSNRKKWDDETYFTELKKQFKY
jgi:short-subunit dehydrogenase